MPQPVLAGLRVLLTRPAGAGADAWASAFAAAGAETIAFPTIAFAPPDSWQPLDQALARLDGYDWLIFTSQTTVRFFVDRLSGRRLPEGGLPSIAAIGDATAAAVGAAGGRVALVAPLASQEGLLEALGGLSSGARVLLPLAEGARPLLTEALTRCGCVVEPIVVYRTVPILDGQPPPPFDVATFASPSALRAFVACNGQSLLVDKVVAVIGPTTADEAVGLGLAPVVAARPTAEALISAIVRAHSSQGDR